MLDASRVRVYGSDAFCLVLGQKLRLELCSPEDSLIFDVPPVHLGRLIARHTLDQANAVPFPSFIKPYVPKLFAARIYEGADELWAACRGLSPDTALIVSEPVRFIAEARLFLLDARVADCAVYEGDKDIDGAAETGLAVATALRLPRTVVVDLGWLENRGWVVIEFNATWGSGLNGCRPERVVPCLAAASGPRESPVG